MSARPYRPLTLEPLEPRTALSVTSALLPGGLLRVQFWGPGEAAITAAGGGVRVNGADLTPGPVMAAAVTAIDITGSAGDDVIDLSGVLPAAFPNLTRVGIDGGGGRDRLLGPDRDQTWLLAGVGSGEILGDEGPGSPGITFSAITDLAGGAGNDAFVVAEGGRLRGGIDGGAGADTLDFGDATTPVEVALLATTGTGFTGAATRLGGGFAGIDRLVGGTAHDRLTGLPTGGQWHLSATVAYTSGNSTLDATGFESLVGGDGPDAFELMGDAAGNLAVDLDGGGGDDRFDFLGGVVLTGNIDGGPGTDTLSFANYGAGVDVQTTATGPDGDAGTEPIAFSGGEFRRIETVVTGAGPPPITPPAPPKPLVVGTGPGPLAQAVVLDPVTEAVRFRLTPYPGFTGGVSVAVGDVTGDGVPDIVTGAGPGGGPHIKVFDGVSGREVRSFFAYAPYFRGGVEVAVADLDGDGYADLITGAGQGGGPHVKVFDGRTGAEVRSFFAYDPRFAGGVSVAVGDVTGDGVPDIVTGAKAGGGPHVRAFDGKTGAEAINFFAFAPSFTGGVSVAAGDLDGDGYADLITGAGPGGGPHVKVFDGRTRSEQSSFYAYDPGFTGGVNVAVGDLNADGYADIVTGAGPGGGPHVKAFDGKSGAVVRSFFTYDESFGSGIRVAAEGIRGRGGAPLRALGPLEII